MRRPIEGKVDLILILRCQQPQFNHKTLYCFQLQVAPWHCTLYHWRRLQPLRESHNCLLLWADTEEQLCQVCLQTTDSSCCNINIKRPSDLLLRQKRLTMWTSSQVRAAATPCSHTGKSSLICSVIAIIGIGLLPRKYCFWKTIGNYSILNAVNTFHDHNGCIIWII